MRSYRYALGFLCAGALIVALGACSKTSTTSTTTTDASPGTAATDAGAAGSTASSGTTTVDTTQGKVTVGKDTSGLPVYPGAKTSGAASGSAGMAGGGTAHATVMTTDDSFDKVVAFYEGQMADAQKVKTGYGGTQVETFVVGAGTNDTKTVVVSATNGKVTISMSHVVK